MDDIILKAIAEIIAKSEKAIQSRLDAVTKDFDEKLGGLFTKMAGLDEKASGAMARANELADKIDAQNSNIETLGKSIPGEVDLSKYITAESVQTAIANVEGNLESLAVKIKSVDEKIVAPVEPDLTGLVTREEFALQSISLVAESKKAASEVSSVMSKMVDDVLALASSGFERVDQSIAAVADNVEAVSAEVKSVKLREFAPDHEIPYYKEGEVVREGQYRRYGVGGVAMAVVDTARALSSAPGDWRVIVDGHSPVPTADGVLYRSLTGESDFLIKHGDKGEDGQRGKQGLPGLRGNDGIGVEHVEVTEKGIAILLTSGKAVGIDLSEPLTKAVLEVADIIDLKVENSVNKFINRSN